MRQVKIVEHACRLPGVAQKPYALALYGIGKALLQSRSLYFPQLKSFRDPYEGMVPTAWQSAIADMSQIPDLGENVDSPESKAVVLSIASGQHLRDETIRDELYVSCWHSNPHESAAMWSLYSRTSGVAIRTTSDRLADAFRDCRLRLNLPQWNIQT
ncbi:MAG: hypothetical protein C5B51_08605 [Terriglobia bacterium]|nr:MAG: hypothetical protein C5B51_08605 [Terriglobia bacterium]